MAECTAFLRLSIQEREESGREPAPSLPGPMRTDGSRTGRAPGPGRKVFSHASTALLVLVLCFGVLLGYGLVNNRWYHVLAVDGGSMQPAIGQGDLIVITKPPRQLKPGMIVTMQVKDKIVTHRVLQVDPLVTQGDANGVPDTWEAEDVRIVGVVRFWVPKLGRLLQKAQLSDSHQVPGFAATRCCRARSVRASGRSQKQTRQERPLRATIHLWSTR